MLLSRTLRIWRAAICGTAETPLKISSDFDVKPANLANSMGASPEVRSSVVRYAGQSGNCIGGSRNIKRLYHSQVAEVNG